MTMQWRGDDPTGLMGEFDAEVEDPMQAARRECDEEIGVPAPVGDLIDQGVHVQPSRRQVRCFAVAAPESLRLVASNVFALAEATHGEHLRVGLLTAWTRPILLQGGRRCVTQR
jgi:predicted NUDIX family NTP pyrophosphohydrolase